jgi:hypothetical protein
MSCFGEPQQSRQESKIEWQLLSHNVDGDSMTIGDALYPACKCAFNHLIIRTFETDIQFGAHSFVPKMQHRDRSNDEFLKSAFPSTSMRSEGVIEWYCEYDTRDQTLTHQQLVAPKPFPSTYAGHVANYPSYHQAGSQMPFLSPTHLFHSQPGPLPSTRTLSAASHPRSGNYSPPLTHRVTHQQQHNPPRSYETPSRDSNPVQARYYCPRIPKTIQPSSSQHHQIVGDPSLRIYRIFLPIQLIQLLDELVWSSERHAATLKTGWFTDLYSLTKQDIALRDIPSQFHACKPVANYIRKCMMALWGVQTIKMDRNQPHILKYSAEEGHTGVELHHDKCDITANLCLSKPKSYIGGG